MSIRLQRTLPPSLGAQLGFTLVELMVTVAIAMFLLAGVVTIVQNIRTSYFNQQALAQFQDQQRFALTVLTDIIQSAGYFPDPTAWTPSNSLPLVSPATYAQGMPFYGTHAGGATPDTIGVRFRTAVNDKIINCNGTSNTAFGPSQVYTNSFQVAGGYLQCDVNGGGFLNLVGGVQNLEVWYGVKRGGTPDNYSADTYLTADQMDRGNGLGQYGNGDWDNVSSVRIQLTFTNPLKGQGQNSPTITVERVIAVMARGGVHT
jgi:type IV pilus assembly protein PilW